LHNRYRFFGGEDALLERQTRLLTQRGHRVRSHVVDNGALLERSKLELLRKLAVAPYSAESYRTTRQLLAQQKPDVVHLHNFWFLLTPSVVTACFDAGVPLVHTLHNFRLFCTAGVFRRNGAECHDCLGRRPWRGVLRGCYRDSVLASYAAYRMIEGSFRRRIWHNQVRAYLVPTRWAAELYARGGLPRDRLHVVPHFVEDPGARPETRSSRPTVLYLGRLSPEKGIQTLVDAWQRARVPTGARLSIAGDGPLRESLQQQMAGSARGIELLGHVTQPALSELIHGADLLLVPSECSETFGLAVVEAAAHGTPALVADQGALLEAIEPGKTGSSFPAGSAPALADALSRLLVDRPALARMGTAARKRYLAHYQPEEHYQALLAVYQRVLSG
jgi:glycosyltransferase involved in cell wall biosynthesis